MCVVNWGEVYYSVWRDQGPGFARHILAQMAQLPIHLVPADVELARHAAEFKANFNLRYVDGFAAALALQRKAGLATSDKDFASVEKSSTSSGLLNPLSFRAEREISLRFLLPSFPLVGAQHRYARLSSSARPYARHLAIGRNFLSFRTGRPVLTPTEDSYRTETVDIVTGMSVKIHRKNAGG
jgi:hypothetical protein